MPIPRLLRLLSWVVLVSTALLAAPGQRPQAERGTPHFALQATEDAAFEPCAAFDSNGTLWTAWIEWRETQDSPGTAALWVAAVDVSGKEPNVLARTVLQAENNELALPQLAAYEGGVYCLWEARDDAGRALFGCELALVSDEVRSSAVERIGLDDGQCLFPSLCALPSGELALVFVGSDATTFDLFAAFRMAPGEAWSEARRLWNTRRDEWHPRIAAGADGAVHLVYDTFDGASFDVAYARLEDGRVAQHATIAGGPSFQACPEVAVAKDGAVWIAWEEAESFGSYGGLRLKRQPRLACLRGDRSYPVRDPLPENRSFPRLAASSTGLLLTFRANASEVGKAARQSGSRSFALGTTIGFDSKHAQLPEALLADLEGDLRSSQSVVCAPDGRAFCVYTSDERSQGIMSSARSMEPIEGRWSARLMPLAAPTGFPALGDAQELLPAPTREPERLAAPEDGEELLLRGDLHRHTTLSRCSPSRDGTIEDAYRYARGPGRLDFIAVTDHFQHMRPWSWWLQTHEANRFDQPGRLVAFPAIERLIAGAGHFNEVFADAARIPYAARLWRFLSPESHPTPPEECVLIPHMIGSRGTPFEWRDFDASRHRLVEIYQGLRGSYEGAGLPYEAQDRVHDASDLASGLASGALFGLIAASDHNSSATAFAGVRAPERSRAAVLAALRARETFASTSAEAEVAFAVGSVHMGAEGALAPSEPVRLSARSRAPEARIAYAEVLKNGKLLHREQGSGGEELIVVSSSLPFAPRFPARLSVAGGTLVGAEVRRDMSGLASVRLMENGQAFLVNASGFDVQFVLRVRWSASASERVVKLDAGRWEAEVSLETVPFGRSLAAGASCPETSVWRLGPPLDRASVEIEVGDPARIAGDAYTARIAWTNGEFAWASPVRVLELAEGR